MRFVDDRLARVLRAGAVQIGLRGVSLAATAATFPLVVDALGANRFGFWITFTGLALIVGSLDLGVGSGLVTAIARAGGSGEGQLSGVVSSAAGGLVLVSMLLLFLTAVVAITLPRWDGFALGAAVDQRDLTGTVLIVGIAAAAGVILSIGPRTQQGLQESHVVGIWQSVGYVAQVLLTVVAWAADASLLFFVVAGVAGPVVAAGANSVWLFNRRPHLRPRLQEIDARQTRDLVSAGALYFALGLSAVIAYQIDALIVATEVGSAAAAEFGFASRLMLTVPMLVGFFVTPLWPAYADALARNEMEWVRRIFRTSLTISAGAGLLVGGLAALVAPALIDRWSLQQVRVDQTLLVALFVVAVQACVGGPVAMLLNGIGIIRTQAAASVVMAAVNLVLSLLLVTRMGLAGPVVATAVTQPIVLVPAFVAARRVLAADAVEHVPRR